MKIILFMAMTINGFIARDNGDEDFLSDINWDTFCKFAKRTGCIIVGKKTYDAVQQWKEYNFDDLVGVKKIVISKNSDSRIDKGYILVSSPEKAINKLGKLGQKSALLIGGGTLNTSFINEGLIDEIILNIEPFVLGKGIKLFHENKFEVKLKLVDCKKLTSGIVQLHYRVL